MILKYSIGSILKRVKRPNYVERFNNNGGFLSPTTYSDNPNDYHSVKKVRFMNENGVVNGGLRNSGFQDWNVNKTSDINNSKFLSNKLERDTGHQSLCEKTIMCKEADVSSTFEVLKLNMTLSFFHFLFVLCSP